jgi:hypothetical protein
MKPKRIPNNRLPTTERGLARKRINEDGRFKYKFRTKK